MKLSQFQWGGWTCVRSAASDSLWPEGLGTADSSVRGLNLMPAIQCGQSEREKQILSAQYLESRTGPVSLLAGQEQRLGLEHRLVDTAREGEVAEGREPAGPQPYRVQAGSVCTCCLTLAVRVLPHFYLSFKTRLWFQVPLEAKSELSHKVWIGLYGIPKALCRTAILALTRHMRTVTQLSPNWTVNS